MKKINIKREKNISEKILAVSLIPVLVFSFSFFSFPKKARAANLSGTLSGLQDYTGQDVIINNVTVTPYDGSANTGWLEVRAANITVTGTIDATGAGYGGGGGGGGSASGSSDSPLLRLGGTGGVGIFGGQNGSNGASQNSSEAAFEGGAGGKGGGSYGGNGGAGGAAGSISSGGTGGNGSLGGYSSSGSNGDSSTDTSVLMGSAGGGAGGGGSGRSDSRCTYGTSIGDVGGGGGAGGGAGNRGGGYVKLIATNNLVINGSIITSGKTSLTGNGANGTAGYCNNTQSNALLGNGGNGGSASDSALSQGGSGGLRTSCLGGNESNFCGCHRVCSPYPIPHCWAACETACCDTSVGNAQNGGAGGTGGAGAGGGIFLQGNLVNLASGTFDSRGGGNNYTNGGTLKVFYASSYTAGAYYVGRLFVNNFNNPPVATIDLPVGATTINYQESVSFAGHGTDLDGTVANYEWWDGGCGTGTLLSSGSFVSNPTAAFSNNTLSSTTVHNINFRVQDNLGVWSTCDTRQVTVRPVCSPMTPPAQSAFCQDDTIDIPGSSNVAITEVGSVLDCTSQKCEYYINPVPGTGGSACHGTFCNKPKEDDNLCISGTPSEVISSADENYWTWECTGSGGGSSENCQAVRSCAWKEVAPN